MREYLDIYNDNHILIGKEEKKEAHKKGLWHEVFTCQFICPKRNTAIFQIKNHNHNGIHEKDLIEITVGGHIKSGETVEDGVREIKEETGLDVNFNELISLGVRQTCVTVNENYIIREFQNIFLFPLDIELEQIKGYDTEEVSGLIEFDIDELIDLLLEKRKMIYGNVVNKKIKITLDNFVLNYLNGDKLYLRLMVAAKRYINNERKELLFW